MGVRQPYIKIKIFCRRKDGMTPEECHAYWTNEHSALAKTLPGFTDLAKRYVQCHCTPELQALSKHLGLQTIDEWDGYTQVWVKNIEEYAMWAKTPELARIQAEDNAKYLHPDMKVMIGYETLEVGEPVPEFAAQK